MAYAVPAGYSSAIRNSASITYTIDATYAGTPVATGLQPSGGTITDTITPGVRRTLSLELAPEPGLFKALKPVGTRLTVTAKVSVNSVPIATIPMGVFDVDQQSVAVGGAGALKITAPDKWQKIVRSKFTFPGSSNTSQTVTANIVNLIHGALGSTEPVQILSSPSKDVAVPALTWTNNDRAQAILDLAKGAGLWVYFDRNGFATIADQRTAAAAADWTMDASPTGTLISLDRTQDRTRTANLVMVESSAASGSAFNTQYAWDQNPASPTFAGSDPVNHPELAGPFGVVPYHYTTPLALQDYQALATAQSILMVVAGLNGQVSATGLPNPAMDAYDAVDFMPPQERYDIAPVVERHFAATVTHPLVPTQPLHIDGVSSRTDGYM